MKIAELLTEATITPYQRSEVSGDFREVLASHCSQAMSTMLTSPIWRGSRSNNNEVMMLDPSSGSRKSENTTNYYTLLMDNSPYMKGWPKRSNSLICSTRRRTAESYGTAYAIFPYNGTKIAVCPGGDLWDTMLTLPEIDYPSITWDSLNYIMQRDLGFKTDRSFADLVDHTKSPEFGDYLARMQQGNSKPVTAEQFIPWLQEKMSPKNTGFVLTNVSSWDGQSFPNNEVWFSAPCVAVRSDIYDTLF